MRVEGRSKKGDIPGRGVGRQAPDGSYFDEQSPVVPDRTLQSVIDGENIVLVAGEKYGFIPSILRCGFFYGPESAHTRTIGEGLKKRSFPIIGSGQNIWSNIHVDDATAAFVTAALEDLEGVWHVVDKARSRWVSL
jgi:nucleoside-diphosphate-sugar epimerase